MLGQQDNAGPMPGSGSCAGSGSSDRKKLCVTEGFPLPAAHTPLACPAGRHPASQPAHVVQLALTRHCRALPGTQVIDDVAGNTLAAASTLTPEIREKLGGSGACNVEAAKLVGLKIAEICKERSIEQVRGQLGSSACFCVLERRGGSGDRACMGSRLGGRLGLAQERHVCVGLAWQGTERQVSFLVCLGLLLGGLKLTR